MAENWVKTTALLCLYGFFKELKPSEPFLTPYLKGPNKNLTEDNLEEIYPVWTYSYLGMLLIALLITDLARYKPVIIIEALAYLTTRFILLFGNGILVMQLMQFAYGIATATEIAYYAYIYAAVSSQYYQKVTSYTRVAILCGRSISGFVGQALLSFHVTDLYALNVISTVNVSIALVLALLLPKIHPKLDSARIEDNNQQVVMSNQRLDLNKNQNTCQTIHQDECPDQSDSTDLATSIENNHTTGTCNLIHINVTSDVISSYSLTNNDDKVNQYKTGWWQRLISFFRFTFCQLRHVYANRSILRWSIWWAISTCGELQVGNYVENLWDVIYPARYHDENVYNGLVLAIGTLLGAAASFALAYVRFDWQVFGELVAGVVSVIDGALLIVMALATNIWLCYSQYIIFRASYALLITIASLQIVNQIEQDCYGLVFGVNMFIALCLQSLLQAVIQGLNIHVSVQFYIYAGYFFLLGICFSVFGTYTIGKIGVVKGWKLSKYLYKQRTSGDGQTIAQSNSISAENSFINL